MADGRDVKVWDVHADQCREQDRAPFEFNGGEWLRQKVVGLEDVSFVLDVGCGPGYWINLFEGLNYVGVDQSLSMLELARELSPNAAFLQGQARELSLVPFNLALGGFVFFDLVFTSSVLQHNRHEPDKREIVEEIAKVLRPGGYLLCTENTFRADNRPRSVGNSDDTDGYSFTPAGWEKFMLALGFELLEFNGQSEYLYRKVS